MGCHGGGRRVGPQGAAVAQKASKVSQIVAFSFYSVENPRWR